MVQQVHAATRKGGDLHACARCTVHAAVQRKLSISMWTEPPATCRIDMSEQHAFEARQSLLRNVSRGEARMNLADAALQIAAEDDAIASHAVVPLPVASYQQRLIKMANEIAHGPLARLPPDAQPADAVKVLERPSLDSP